MTEEQPTTILDIYVASGGTLSEDGESVSLPKPGEAKPFDITLRVFPIGIEMPGMNQKELVKFAVHLKDEMVFNGPYLEHVYHDAELVLPVDQIRVVKEETE